jgi:hypothetical protein
MVTTHHDDRERAAFYARSLLASEPDMIRPLPIETWGSGFRKLFAIEPDHPGVAHYLIRSCDQPQLALLLGCPPLDATRKSLRLLPRPGTRPRASLPASACG